ncbi:Ig-like domain-containing protein [Planococcus shixiaomingii]|uniref:Ig-like domain-containing protein n=1 Tax=Planococcus shixiaomingii TaxID=3058393 RepID=UPI00262466F1|nr:Ig-like domain-containing protein [Planococcus sp. N022]WKA55861.1 Ig-like domain-containing protein [Planococcus sp. N022]
MGKKAFVSIALTSLLVFPFSYQQAYANESNSEAFKNLVEQREEKSLKKDAVDSTAIEKLEETLKTKRSSKANASRSSTSNDYLVEKEFNDDFVYANTLSYSKPTIGQLLPLFDVDFYKIKVPQDGALLVGGATSSESIYLMFAAVEKDWKKSGKLEYLGSEFDVNTEVQVYQAKAGTYYVPVIDEDMTWDYYYDDNTPEDLYSIVTAFVDNVKPGKPTINKVDNNDVKVTGKAEANSTVTVKRGTTVLKSVKATSAGTFSAAIPVQKAGTKLAVTAKDSAGNISSAATATVADVIAPSKPTINKVDSNDLKVTGKAEAGSTVTVKAGSTTLGSAVADAKGVYSVKIKAQKKGTTLTVTAKDKAGNVSSKATYVVVKH